MEIGIQFRYALLEARGALIWKVLNISAGEYFDREYIQGPDLDIEDLPVYDDPRMHCPVVERPTVRYVAILIVDELDNRRSLHRTYWGVDSRTVEVVNAGPSTCDESLIISSKTSDVPPTYHIMRFERATRLQPWIPVLADIVTERQDGQEDCLSLLGNG